MPDSFEVNVNDALVEVVAPMPAVIVVSGGVVSVGGGVMVVPPGPYCWSATRQVTPRPLA